MHHITATFKLHLYSCFLLSVFFISCKESNKSRLVNSKNSSFISTVKYAKGFDIQLFDNYKKLIIKSPYPDADSDQVFILKSKKIDVTHKKSHEKILDVPLTNIVATSTTHIPMLELIQEERSLIGFPHSDYISSQKTRKLINKGHIKEVGMEQDFNTEILIELQPDAIIGFSMGNSTKMYDLIEKNGIPVIYNGDWLEETPLGRAEWIKFFGVLFDKNEEADSIFDHIELKYLEAKQIAQKSNQSPKILSGVLFKDQWNLPAGESFTAQLLKDANTQYIWNHTKGQGSLVLSFESVFEKARDADYWIGSGYYTSLNELFEANNHYSQFKPFKQDEIYTFSKKRGETGGVIYFELAPVQPHIVLQDLIKVTHPDLLPNYRPFFLEKLE